MIIYQSIKSEFLKDVNDHDIEQVILDRFKFHTGHKVGNAELQSWKNSLGYMSRVLSDQDIPNDCGIAIESGFRKLSIEILIPTSKYISTPKTHFPDESLKTWIARSRTLQH